MVFFTDDIWAIILVLLPLKTITASKLVCKQWKSIVESSFFRELFLTRHQNSHYSSWSLMCNNNNDTIEVLADYGCEIWGLQQPLNSYINSFISKLKKLKRYKCARVVAYTDVGLVLIRVESRLRNVYYYVANPVSRECIKTDPPWCQPKEYSRPLGIATRTEKNGVLSGFKVVLLFDVMPCKVGNSLQFLIYSSDTGLWRPETVNFLEIVSFQFSKDYPNFISSNGNLHCLARNSNHDKVVVSIDFYSADSSSIRCLVTPFPDLGKVRKFGRVCTTCQGYFTYMNVIKVEESVGEIVYGVLKAGDGN